MPVDPSAPRNVERYEGQWLEGKQHGVGYYYQADGSRLFSFLLFFLRIESHLLFHPSLSPICSPQPFILRRREELLANALIILFLKCFLQSACLVLLFFFFARTSSPSPLAQHSLSAFCGFEIGQGLHSKKDRTRRELVT